MKPGVLLVNPTITAASRARFPLSILSLAAALGDEYDVRLIDGNVQRETIPAALKSIEESPARAVGLTVMGGPQIAPAIALSRAIRDRHPELPIVWGGYFPTLYPQAALNNDYVDFAVRGEGEQTFRRLLAALPGATRDILRGIPGLCFRDPEGVHVTTVTPFANVRSARSLPYELLREPQRYLVPSFLGARTASHQASLGCRFRCTFCGVAAMFRGGTALPAAERLDAELGRLRAMGADSVQYYDHNFFDREEDMVPLLEVMARHALPWWCYARADALLGLSAESWALVRRSGLRMAYIGAESPSDTMLREIRKGTRADQTLEVAELCRRQGVIPELSFMVAPPHDPEGETQRTFDFIREVKRVNPQSEIIVYVYTPLPAQSVPDSQRLRLAPLRDLRGQPVEFPRSAEEWTQAMWVDYACHADAPWLSDRLRRRIRDFVTVLRCRFPTVQDTRSPAWAKVALRGLASWRYSLQRYDRPWELNATRGLIGLLDPRTTGI
jgi:anaerobic magnesium-protoporphyrin IX monomethyl ester cyclase